MPIFYQKYVCSLKKHCSQGHILSKKRPFSKKKTVLSWYFSQIFNENSSTPNPIFDPKSVNSVKTSLYYGPTKSIRCLSFPIFHGNVTVLVPKICKKITQLSCPYLVKKSQFCQDYAITWAKKSIGCPLFLIFTNKLLL